MSSGGGFMGDYTVQAGNGLGLNTASAKRANQFFDGTPIKTFSEYPNNLGIEAITLDEVKERQQAAAYKKYREEQAEADKKYREEIRPTKEWEESHTLDEIIEKYADPNYKLNDTERESAKKIIDQYFDYSEGPLATLMGKYYFGPDDPRVAVLMAKTDPIEAALSGVVDGLSLPEWKKAMDDGTAFVAGLFDQEDADFIRNESNRQMDNFNNIKAAAVADHPIAYGAGAVGGTAAEYMAGSELLKGVPAVGKVLTTAGETINAGLKGAGAVGQAASNIFTSKVISAMLENQILDTMFDTIPNALGDIQNGENLETIGSNAAKSIGTNALFNIAPELVGTGVKSVKNAIKNGLNDPAVKQILNGVSNIIAPVDDALGGVVKQADDVANAARITDQVADAAKQIGEIPVNSQTGEAASNSLKQLEELVEAARQSETGTPGMVSEALIKDAGQNVPLELPVTTGEIPQLSRNSVDLLSPQSYAENALPAVLPQASQTDDLAKALEVTPQQGTAPIALPEAKQLEIKENGDPLETYFNGFDEGRTGESVAETAGQSGARAQGAALDAAGVRQDADVNAALSGQRAGELAEGAGETSSDSDILIDSYKNMRNAPDVIGQSHHLNQDAAFRDVIPKSDGLCIELEGNAFRDVGSPHYLAHENLENFWNNFRSKGDLYGETPKISDYNVALYNSLRAAGLSDNQAKVAVQNAVKQQLQYGLTGDSFIPRIPGRINFKK